MVEIVLYLLASHHFRSAVDNNQLVELCSLYCLSDHITVRIAGDLSRSLLEELFYLLICGLALAIFQLDDI